MNEGSTSRHLFSEGFAVALAVSVAHQCGIGVGRGGRGGGRCGCVGLAGHSGGIEFLDQEARGGRQRKLGHHQRLPLDSSHGKVGIEGVAFERPFRPDAGAGSL